MTSPLDIPLLESLDTWDADDIRDLIPTTPLRFDDEGMPAGYDAEQLFDFKAQQLSGGLL